MGFYGRLNPQHMNFEKSSFVIQLLVLLHVDVTDYAYFLLSQSSYNVKFNHSSENHHSSSFLPETLEPDGACHSPSLFRPAMNLPGSKQTYTL